MPYRRPEQYEEKYRSRIEKIVDAAVACGKDVSKPRHPELAAVSIGRPYAQ